VDLWVLDLNLLMLLICDTDGSGLWSNVVLCVKIFDCRFVIVNFGLLGACLQVWFYSDIG